MMSANMFRLLFSGRLHPIGWKFVRWTFLILVFSFFIHSILFNISLFLLLFFVIFFRDPDRVLPAIDKALVSSADGTVVQLRYIVPPEELGMGDTVCLHIGIFMAPWNVHVNRIPYDGKIVKRVYRPGNFSHVAREESLLNNERLGLVIETQEGLVGCVQIAGFLARRIVCKVEEGEKVKCGQKYGIICFGSHMDLYLPAGSQVCTAVGQAVRGGESILALFSPSLIVSS